MWKHKILINFTTPIQENADNSKTDVSPHYVSSLISWTFGFKSCRWGGYNIYLFICDNNWCNIISNIITCIAVSSAFGVTAFPVLLCNLDSAVYTWGPCRLPEPSGRIVACWRALCAGEWGSSRTGELRQTRVDADTCCVRWASRGN